MAPGLGDKLSLNFICHPLVINTGDPVDLLMTRSFFMLHAENQDRLYLVAQSDEQQALIDGFAINVQDRQWLVYCALGGHVHEDLPEVDAGTGFSLLDFHIEAA
jgi:hypothetical protein